MTSACGLCGKERLDQIERQGIPPLAPGPTVDWRTITSLPGALREAQGLFSTTGGLHAAALFTPAGEMIAVREDVGRHNAVDKVIGWSLLETRLPLSDVILMVSGRSSFEIAQKALAAGIPILCAVSAPSSLAVDLAQRFGLTLVGFLRGERFNVYAGVGRVGGMG
jgi:FdhD protein